MRVAEGTFDPGMQIFEEFAGAGLHCGSAGEESGVEELFGFVQEGGVVTRKIHETLKGKRADDGAAVVDVAAQRGGGALPFGWREGQAGNHLCEVPAKLDLFGLSQEAQELRFVASEEAGILARNFFGGVSGSDAHDGILVPVGGDEFGEAFWILDDELNHVIGTADGAAVGARENGGDFCFERYRFERICVGGIGTTARCWCQNDLVFNP